MRKILLAFLICCSSGISAQEQSHLDGTLTISLADETIEATYILSNLPVNSQKLSFRLNEHLKVKQIYLNDDPIASSKVPQDCKDCLKHNININRPINPLDKIKITAEGKFKKLENAKDVKRYKGEIVYANGVLKAGDTDHWYPDVIRTTSSLSSYLNPFNLTYSITAVCEACEEIYIGNGKPQSSGSTFKNDQAQDNIVLLAGDFNFTEGRYANYINVSSKDIEALEQRFAKKMLFLEEFTQGAKVENKMVYAQLDLPVYGSEKNNNIILNTTKKLDANKVDDNLNESTAYHYMVDAFDPETNVDHMFIQSLAKYAKIKYLEKYNPTQYQAIASLLRGNTTVDTNNTPSNSRLQALLITPEQFLELESTIGEQNMKAFLKNTFQNLKFGKSSLTALTNSMAQINIKSEKLSRLKSIFIDQFKIRGIDTPEEVLVGF